MDPRRRRIVWGVIAAIGLGLIADGVISAITNAAYGGRTYGLARDDRVVPVWFGAPPGPQDHARLIAGSSRFGLHPTFLMPDGSRLRCHFVATRTWCADGWKIAYTAPGPAD